MVSLRPACRADIGGMHAVRMSVRENQLTSVSLDESDYSRAIELDGRGWVVELNGSIIASAVGNATEGSIWALFVHPDHEGRGFGRQLHDAVVGWLWSQGFERLWLTTSPHTRAAGFYERAGWRRVAVLASGDIRYELGR
jgi:GNAT superfamily N-acetyltransferase